MWKQKEKGKKKKYPNIERKLGAVQSYSRILILDRPKASFHPFFPLSIRSAPNSSSNLKCWHDIPLNACIYLDLVTRSSQNFGPHERN